MGRNKKDKFEDLDDDFKDSVAGLDGTAIRKKIAEIALANADLMAAKEADEDLAQKQEVAKEAGAIYREGVKMNRLRIEFAKRVLVDRGEYADQFEQE